MQITFFSFLISVVWSSILIIAIYCCRKTRFFICQFGVTSLVLLYFFCIIRMALPLDFTFTRGVPFGGVFSDFYECVAIYKIGASGLSVLTVLSFLWIAVSVVLVLRYAHQYCITMRKVSSYAIRKDEQCKKVFACVINNSKKQVQVNIRHSREVNIPIGVGVFCKSIVLPDENYSDKELYCILMHEYTHFLNRDLLVKMLTQIFRCIFWWNPIVYLLGRDLGQTLEIKCDLCVTEQMNNRDKADYLTTIVSILKKANEAKQAELLCGTTELASKDCESGVIERFRIISEDRKLRSRNKVLTALWLSAFVIIFILSYSFVVQPCYEAPIEEIETEPNTQELRPDNTYIIKNKNGTYTIVMPGGDRQNVDGKYVTEMEKQGFEIVEEEK